MHHGTILYDSDLNTVAQVLRVDPEKVQAKGVRSVRARVTTVRANMPRPIPLEQFKTRLLEEISRDRPMQPYALTQADIAAVEAIQAARYDRWEWNYGISPPCDVLRRRRVEGCGKLEVHMDVAKGGAITALAFYGDYFGNGDSAELAQRLAQPDTAITYSDTARNPCAVYTGEDGGRYQVWYEDGRSARDKIHLARLFGINGLSIWRLGNIPNYDSYDLWSAVLAERP